MKFENVSILIENIKDLIKDMRYCWLDNEGMICEQRGVFRINCIDCLDRTNIVMTAIARQVMDTQVRNILSLFHITSHNFLKIQIKLI
jgi:hypothetical protein